MSDFWSELIERIGSTAMVGEVRHHKRPVKRSPSRAEPFVFDLAGEKVEGRKHPIFLTEEQLAARRATSVQADTPIIRDMQAPAPP